MWGRKKQYEKKKSNKKAMNNLVHGNKNLRTHKNLHLRYGKMTYQQKQVVQSIGHKWQEIEAQFIQWGYSETLDSALLKASNKNENDEKEYCQDYVSIQQKLSSNIQNNYQSINIPERFDLNIQMPDINGVITVLGVKNGMTIKKFKTLLVEQEIISNKHCAIYINGSEVRDSRQLFEDDKAMIISIIPQQDFSGKYNVGHFQNNQQEQSTESTCCNNFDLKSCCLIL